MFRYLLATTALIGGIPTMAFAQSPQGGGTATLEEVVVTASRREETTQKSALSVQAITAESLTRSGVTRPEDLGKIAPGVVVGTGGVYPQTYIRGVGNYAADVHAEGAVAYNLDGVYISRGWGIRGAIFDLERVEVLKGPQGTLYGRNASGGAINLITAKPVLGEYAGFAEIELGSYNLQRAAGAVNIPLNDTLAARASMQVVRHDGYLSDGYNDEESESARLHLMWKPSDAASLLVTGGYQHIGGMGGAGAVTPVVGGDPWRGPSDPGVLAILAAQPRTGALLIKPDKTGFVDIEVHSIGATLDWDLGPATLTVAPAYRTGKFRDLNYSPSFRVRDAEDESQTSLEVRLANATDRLKWVVGGYYFDEDQANPDNTPLLVVQQGVNVQVVPKFASETYSVAGFGQLTFSVTDRFRLTGGLRNTYERKTQNGTTIAYGFPNAAAPPLCLGSAVFTPTSPYSPLLCATTVPLVGRQTYRNTTWKVGFEMDLAEHSMFYGNASTGFKSGGFIAAPTPNTFGPEELTAYDIGVKNRFFDNTLQVNLEAFYWEYKGHQESHLGPTSIPGFFTFTTENAGEATSYGADLDVEWLATPDDKLTAKIQYNPTNYDSFIYSNSTGVFGPPVTGCKVGLVVNGVQGVDCSGKPLVRSPEWSGTLGYEHTFRLSNDASVVVEANSQFATSSYNSIDFLELGRQRSYATFDANLTYNAPRDKWSISAYVRNLTDEAVYSGAVRYPFVSTANPFTSSLMISTIRPPRTFGVRLRANF